MQSVQVIEPREVPLGGLRAMTVRRTLPSRERSLVGAWCFLDHYGPDEVRATGGMSLARHPHTGLATVSWLFTGAIDHLDSAGNAARVVPGELNLMSAGRGITHSEFTTEDTEILHGVQLWFAFPDRARNGEPGFDHYAPQPVRVDGGQAWVFLGSLVGSTSPVQTPAALVGAELRLTAGAALTMAVDPRHEHALLVDQGASVEFEGQILNADDLGFVASGTSELTITVGVEDVRLILIGGEPLGEQFIMWWNFIGRTQEEIEEYRSVYQHEIESGVDGRFGPWPEGEPAPIPAPTMPNARLRPRG